MLISKTVGFEASHVLPLHPGKCSRLHGHSWIVVVTVEGLVNEATGFVCDFAHLGDLLKKEVVGRLDHQHLGVGQLVGKHGRFYDPVFGEDFYPSSENLALALFRMLKPLVRELPGRPHLNEVRIQETCTSEAICRISDLPLTLR